MNYQYAVFYKAFINVTSLCINCLDTLVTFTGSILTIN